MSRNYTDEYLALIEEVAEDGELSKQEIYRLAKWLNENKDGRTTWPANQFLPMLKDVFSDGQIDVSEAQQVGGLIQRVRREWARSQAELVPAKKVNPIELASSYFDDTQPALLRFGYALNVASFSEPDEVYRVDLSEPSCTCPDFKSYRSHLPLGHLSRCCKHIMQAYAEIRPENGWPSWLDAFLEGGFRPHPDQVWQVVRTTAEVYLVSSANPEWGNVYVMTEMGSQTYGYSIAEERWSYGKTPADANLLARAIHRISNA